MIGVMAKDSHRNAMEEFFEMFKTPWEFFQKDKNYDVIICSSDEKHDSFNARLIFIFNADSTSYDKDLGIVVKNKYHASSFSIGEINLPIYNGVSCFEKLKGAIPVISQNSEIFGFRLQHNQQTFLRIGYDLFREIAFLLREGQPPENAAIPTFEIHIDLLRTWILEEGIPVIEIPPIPEGHDFIVSLTHDVDFIKIRNHLFDHTMIGFLYRAIFGCLVNFLRGRIPLSRVLKNWKAVFSLPLVFLCKKEDFWHQFERYEEIERGETSTFFIVPYKNTQGDKFHSNKRASKYDIMDVRKTVKVLIQNGHEVGVHGIDAWYSQEKGSRELRRVSDVTGHEKVGIRMHWLLFDLQTFSNLEEAGYHYDSTLGYNDAVGYRNGMVQVFLPFGATNLLELPLHIQDTALFYPHRMNLSEKQALTLCNSLIKNSSRYGGVLTINWHQRSLAPERLWEDFYLHLLEILRFNRPWFATAHQVIDWYQKRRLSFFDVIDWQTDKQKLVVRFEDTGSLPRLLLRIYRPKDLDPSNFQNKNSPGFSYDYMDFPLEKKFQFDVEFLGLVVMEKSS